jgi:uncharacterized protein DUF2585
MAHAPSTRLPRWLLVVPALIVFQIAVLFAMGRTPICTCGTIKLWHGSIWSSENSQHLLDWYSLTHVVHGLVFYFVLWALLPRTSVALRLVAAVTLEVGWEIFENTNFIIDRYRTDTVSLHYHGDSIVNSVADTFAMMAGFALAARLPAWSAVTAVVVIELALGYLIRDNLTLNIAMLIYPLDVVRHWQAAAAPPLP